jgi:hypothetical protein
MKECFKLHSHGQLWNELDIILTILFAHVCSNLYFVTTSVSSVIEQGETATRNSILAN